MLALINPILLGALWLISPIVMIVVLFAELLFYLQFSEKIFYYKVDHE